MNVTVRNEHAVVFAAKYSLLTCWWSARGVAGLEWWMQATWCGCFGVPLSNVFAINVQWNAEGFHMFQLHWHPTALFLRAITSGLCVWSSIMIQRQMESLCSSSTLISEGGSQFKIPDDSEFLLFLFLEQCGSRRLFRTIRPNFVQVKTFSFSSDLQREGNIAYSIWESKYLNHNWLLNFYSLYLQ